MSNFEVRLLWTLCVARRYLIFCGPAVKRVKHHFGCLSIILYEPGMQHEQAGPAGSISRYFSKQAPPGVLSDHDDGHGDSDVEFICQLPADAPEPATTAASDAAESRSTCDVAALDRVGDISAAAVQCSPIPPLPARTPRSRRTRIDQLVPPQAVTLNLQPEQTKFISVSNVNSVSAPKQSSPEVIVIESQDSVQSSGSVEFVECASSVSTSASSSKRKRKLEPRCPVCATTLESSTADAHVNACLARSGSGLRSATRLQSSAAVTTTSAIEHGIMKYLKRK